MIVAAASPLAALGAQNCRAGARLLSPAKLEPRLHILTGWNHAGGRLRKTYRFADFYRTMAFVNAIAWMANQQNHHPDLSVHYNHVVVDWSTHDAGGATLNDCICAARTEQLAP
ncbi:MAG: 4a-hydroxytetrahydrobiopterin dehydratase [Casimicrobiaceae bacterium]